MRVTKLIAELKAIEKQAGGDAEIRVASDEEWNTIYNDIEINQNDEGGEFVIFGLSGSEQDNEF